MTLTIDRPLRAEPVDAQHPDRVAMLQGPLALFATGGAFEPYRREQLSALTQRAGAARWVLPGVDRGVVFRPWFAFGTEPARLYQWLAV